MHIPNRPSCVKFYIVFLVVLRFTSFFRYDLQLLILKTQPQFVFTSSRHFSNNSTTKGKLYQWLGNKFYFKHKSKEYLSQMKDEIQVDMRQLCFVSKLKSKFDRIQNMYHRLKRLPHLGRHLIGNVGFC